MIKTKYPTTKPSLNLDFANTKSLDPRITFRRGTPGTYYDGVTHAKAEENLLSYSEDFSQWEQNQNTIDSTLYDAPDGSQTASKIIANSTSANHWMLRNESISSGKTYTMSIYAKAAGYNYLTIFESTRFADDFTGWVTFNLTGDGSIAYATDIVSHSITNVGNDWYRCSVTAIATSDGSGRFGIKPRPDTQGGMNPVFTGDDSSGMLFWGAQLEQRDTVTAYTTTMREDGTSAPITKYQPKLMTAAADQARFDHDPLTGESKGLLIEEQRSNLIAYSEDFTQSFWNENRSSVKTNDHIFPNQLIAPDGVSSATKIVPRETESDAIHYVSSSNLSVSQNTVYTASCYFKAAEIDTVSIALKKYNGLVNWVNFNLTDVTATPAQTFDDYSIQDVGNGWRRCSISLNLGTGFDTDAGTLYFYVKQASVWIGNNYDGLYMWGAQVEAGSFPTSYIKTTGASATRSADNASITGENFSSWYRQDEGSIYSEVSTSDFRSSYPRIMINDGSVSNRIVMSFFGAQGLRVASNGVQYIDASNPSSSDDGNYHKRAIGLKKDSFSFYTNGESVISDSAGEMPINVDRFAFYNNLSSNPADHLNGHIKKLAYYPQRLTNEQLQNLTK